MPVALPVTDPAVMLALLLLTLHTPPEVVSDKSEARPAHTVSMPVIGPANGGMPIMFVTLLVITTGL